MQLIEFGMNALIVAHQQASGDHGVHILMDTFVIPAQVPRQGGYGWIGARRTALSSASRLGDRVSSNGSRLK